MKKLNKLEERLLHYDIEAREEEKNALPKVRRALCLIVGTAKGKDGEDALNITQLGLKLRVDGDIELGDVEFRLLERLVKENPLNWPGFLHGQVLNYIASVEKENSDKKG